MIRMDDLGKHIRAMRLERKLTQSKLAEKCEVVPETICSIENGKRYPSVDLLISLAENLDTTVDTLLDPAVYSSTERKAVECLISRIARTANSTELIGFMEDLSELLVKYFSK